MKKPEEDVVRARILKTLIQELEENPKPNIHTILQILKILEESYNQNGGSL